MQEGGRVHLRALDGLRGVAVLGVLGFHLAPLDGGDRSGVLPGGWLGVDAFFTLSGYLITGLLLAEAERARRIDLRAFWRRRIRRLQPAALVAVAVIALAAPWWAGAGSGRDVLRQAAAAVTGLSNWEALQAGQAYATGAAPSAFEHFWSLAVEEQFYLGWPLLVALVVAAGGGRRAVGALALTGTVASWALLASVPPERGYVGTDSRMGSILLGAALAAALPLAAHSRPKTGALLAGVGAGLSAVLWLRAGWPPSLPLDVVLPVQALATATILAGVVLAPASATARVLSTPALAGIGRVSYGVYLWHWPVFVVVTPTRLGAGPAATNLVRLALVAVLVGLSWLLVERPVRLEALLPRTRVALPSAVGLVLLVTAIAVQGVGPTPAWARAEGQVLAATAPVADRASQLEDVPAAEAAEPELATEPVAPPAPGVRPQRVLVIGDSIPTSLLATADASGDTLQVGVGRLLDQLAARGMQAWSATITGCPVIEAVIVIDGHPWRDCLDKQQRVFAAAFEAARPDLVVWYSRQDAHPVLLDDGGLDRDPRNLRRRIEERVDGLAAEGAGVLFVSPGPNRDGHDAYAPDGSSRRSMARLDGVLHAVAATHPDVVGVVRMASLLCGPGPGCRDRRPDGGTYRDDDGVHFSATGAPLAGAWLADRISEVRLPAAAARRR